MKLRYSWIVLTWRGRRDDDLCPAHSELLARLNGVCVKGVLEGEEEGSGDDTLSNLGPDACSHVNSGDLVRSDASNIPPYKPV